MGELTLKDIQKALAEIKKEPLTRQETPFGFVEVDIAGNIHIIGLNDEAMKEVNDFIELGSSIQKLPKGKVTTFMGVKIVVSDKLKDKQWCIK